MAVEDQPAKSATHYRGLREITAAATTGLILASVDFMGGLMRLWGAEARPIREFQSYAAAAAFFAAAALLLQTAVRPVVRRGGRPPAADLRMFSAGAALAAGYVAGAVMPEGFSPLDSAGWGVSYVLAVALPLALTLAWLPARLQPRGKDVRPVQTGRAGRLWTSAAFGLATFVAATAWVRASAPDAGLLWSRLGPATAAATVWLGCLAVLRTRKGELVRWAAGALFAAVLLQAGMLPARPRLTPRPGSDSPPDGVSRIVLITIDTLRADALSCYGDGGTSTPNIDRLARRGLRFTRAIAPSPWTLPSLASLMTGVAVPVHSATSHTAPIPAALPTLAERLRDAGFVTGAVGRNSFLVGLRGLGRGFQSYDMYPRAPKLNWPTFGGVLLRMIRPLPQDMDVGTRRIADLAIDWMDVHRDRPFFLWCHFFDPHIPYAPPPKFLPLGRAPARLGNEVADVRPLREGTLGLNDRERAWVRELYLGEVRFVDAEVGRILDALDALPRAEETLVILTSDHGEEFWEHGGFEHGHALYQEVIHVPLIMAHAGNIDPGVVDRNVNITALFPTILRLAGLESGPPGSDPSSLPALAPGEPVERPVFSTGILYGPDREAVIDNGWKFIRGRENKTRELFDLRSDPAERENLSAEAASRVRVASEALDRWRRQAELRRERLGADSKRTLDLPEDTLQDLERLGYIE